MKYPLILLTLLGISTSATLHAEDSAAENNNAALTELCNTYAEEDGISDGKKSAYLQECLSNMTDLTESIQEDLPLAAAEETPELTESATKPVNNTPEKLVQNELVETPDPSAEQLSAGK
ncbi:hypothetical protein HMY34_10225 [Thiothrix subterranea]|uniref:hypothetical protein n=1 Tax=Thiothrix subterranea TaxID=2735563 RepID=UPI00192B265D|nr:hypothetical protein [Thiothrix subterranea]QQZ29108.1 hypothetical protein HMY34_10225 [Thiothrix subterranea]